jgi:hypothetical protein
MKATMSGNNMSNDVFQFSARATIRPVVEEILKEIESER